MTSPLLAGPDALVVAELWQDGVKLHALSSGPATPAVGAHAAPYAGLADGSTLTAMLKEQPCCHVSVQGSDIKVKVLVSALAAKRNDTVKDVIGAAIMLMQDRCVGLMSS